MRHANRAFLRTDTDDAFSFFEGVETRQCSTMRVSKKAGNLSCRKTFAEKNFAILRISFSTVSYPRFVVARFVIAWFFQARRWLRICSRDQLIKQPHENYQKPSSKAPFISKPAKSS